MQVISEGVNQIDGALTCFWFGVSWFQDCKRGKTIKNKMNIISHSSIKERRLEAFSRELLSNCCCIPGSGYSKLG